MTNFSLLLRRVALAAAILLAAALGTMAVLLAIHPIDVLPHEFGF